MQIVPELSPCHNMGRVCLVREAIVRHGCFGDVCYEALVERRVQVAIELIVLAVTEAWVSVFIILIVVPHSTFAFAAVKGDHIRHIFEMS